ncbi:unnamed protein product [Citrullus colocynthis]|uniref:Transmembrane protein n=1 Tax=Citrullus colocynthis TaxID=252529 RepID=A0ABP0XWJ8_9ROSI
MNNWPCVCTKSNVPNSVEKDGKRKKLKAESEELGNFPILLLDSFVDSKARMKRGCFGVFAVMILLAMVFVRVDGRPLRSRSETPLTTGIGRVEKVTAGNSTAFVTFGGHRKGRWAFKHASGPSMRGPGH